MRINTLIGIVLYAVFGVALGMFGITVTDKPVAFFSLMGILLAVDLLSFSGGINRGIEIGRGK